MNLAERDLEHVNYVLDGGPRQNQRQKIGVDIPHRGGSPPPSQIVARLLHLLLV